MPSRLSGGKRKGLEAVADSRGIIAALAIDQRSALRSLFSRAMGVEAADVPPEKLSQFKEAVSSILTPHASAILLDPEYGLPAAAKRAKNAGLLLAVEKVGADCTASDVPFFLELVSYAENMDEKGIEFARIKHEVVAAGMMEFSKPEYRVDILKVGMPVNLSSVEGSPSCGGEILHTREQAKQHFLLAAACASIPFIYLSEGVSSATFQFGLQLAAEAGAKFSGVLCGRATWKDGVEIFVKQGLHALQDWLGREGVRNIENVNQCLSSATPWFEASGLAAPRGH